MGPKPKSSLQLALVKKSCILSDFVGYSVVVGAWCCRPSRLQARQGEKTLLAFQYIAFREVVVVG